MEQGCVISSKCVVNFGQTICVNNNDAFFILYFFKLKAKFDSITTWMQFEKSAALVMKFMKYWWSILLRYTSASPSYAGYQILNYDVLTKQVTSAAFPLNSNTEIIDSTWRIVR